MATLDQKPHDAGHEIGELCAGGDWACAHGDLETLGHLLRRLAAYTRAPLRSELAALAEQCGGDPERAAAAWRRGKALVQAPDRGKALVQAPDR